MQVFNKRKGISAKLLKSLIVSLIIVIVVSSLTSGGAMAVLQRKSADVLVEQALSSAEKYTKGQSDAIGEELDAVISQLEQAASFTEYVYRNPDKFEASYMPTPDDIKEEYEGNLIHWLPYSLDLLENEDVVNEAYMLSALEGEFESITETCPIIYSLYVATTSGINIGYDGSALAKQGLDGFNPGENGSAWYLSPLETGKNYISDAYNDTFGRGLCVTVSVPYSVNGEVYGVIGADFVIKNINEAVLDLDMGASGGYAMLFSKDAEPICAENIDENTTSVSLLGNKDAVNCVKENDEGVYEVAINGEDSYIVFRRVESTGWKLVFVLSVKTVTAPAENFGSTIVLMQIIMLGIELLLLLVMLLAAAKTSKRLSAPLLELTEKVKDIGEGSLDYVSDIKTGDEIELLSDSFKSMTDSLKNYITNLTAVTAEKERIGAELDVAAHIQSSMLPCIFPAFPDNNNIDIYATMTPAKEVGGDFYDFFFVDKSHLAIVMADVSGKGVPAALFMVIGKTLIKDHTVSGKDLGEVFSEVNEMLCEANSEGLFITAFEGVLDLVTGEFRFVNAGHEMPFISRNGAAFEPYKIRAGFVLAGMEGMRYKAGSVQLNPGDKVFQYTDGVTEATDINNRLFGMERLEASLAKVSKEHPADILPALKKDIDTFVGEADQFDDITMLCLEYKERMTEDERNNA